MGGESGEREKQRKMERQRGKGTEQNREGAEEEKERQRERKEQREKEKGKVHGKNVVMCFVEKLFVSGGSFSMYRIMPYVGSEQAWNSA